MRWQDCPREVLRSKKSWQDCPREVGFVDGGAVRGLAEGDEFEVIL